MTTAALVVLPWGAAFAAGPAVSIPDGPFADGQEITVTGSGFPTLAQAPAGLQIIECSDPQGSVANLPIDATSGCEGITVNPSQVSTDKSGSFHASYRIAGLSSSSGTSSIDCDPTHLSVLWVGTDYNNAFTSGPHAFTKPFAVAAAPTSVSTTAVPAAGASTGSSPTTTTAPTTQAAAGSQPTLASTGVSGLVLWLSGAGGAMALLGFTGRRVIAKRSR